jgi:hypothetical protein
VKATPASRGRRAAAKEPEASEKKAVKRGKTTEEPAKEVSPPKRGRAAGRAAAKESVEEVPQPSASRGRGKKQEAKESAPPR